MIFLLASVMAGIVCALAVWGVGRLLSRPTRQRVEVQLYRDGDETSLFDEETVSILLAWVWNDPMSDPVYDLMGLWLVRIVPGYAGVSVVGFSPWLWLDWEGRRLVDAFDNPNLTVAAHMVADRIEELVSRMGLGVELEPGADAVLVVDQYAFICAINRYGPVEIGGVGMDGQEAMDYVHGADDPISALERQRRVMEATLSMLRRRYTQQRLEYLMMVLERHGESTLRRRDMERFVHGYVLNLAHPFSFVVPNHVPMEPPPPDGLPALYLVP